MTNLLLPVAGRSSRFPDMRPKWLLSFPDGLMMIEKAIDHLDLSEVDDIYVVCLQEHLDKFIDQETLQRILAERSQKNIHVVSLDEPTSSQSETVVRGIEKGGISGPFFIKDCDNAFSFKPVAGNQIVYSKLSDHSKINAGNKSYVSFDTLGHVTNIIEKTIVGENFCVGGYSFESSEAFTKAYYDLPALDGKSEIYVSHVIYAMLMAGEDFTALPCSGYLDFGTAVEFREYCAGFMTLFCDVDGILCRHEERVTEDEYLGEIIHANIEHLKGLQAEKNLYLVLTSSRSEKSLASIRAELEKLGLTVNAILGGLPQSKRVLINNYSMANPYPTASAVNLKQNSDGLADLLTE